MKNLFQKLKNLRKSNINKGFEYKTTSNGINFFTDAELLKKAREKQGDSLSLNQFIILQMLVEEGLGEFTDKGFFVSTEDASLLDDNTRYLLKLPEIWPGSFQLSAKGQTRNQDFELNLHLILPTGEIIKHYWLKGPFLKISESETFLPNNAQWQILSTIKDHIESEKTEYNNLHAIFKLQQAKEMGIDIDLSHFNNLQMTVPENISLSVDEQCDGSLQLIPNFGGIGSPDEVRKRLGQLGSDKVQSIRIKDTFVLLDEKKFEATQEIIQNKTIPKNLVKQFLETPSAFIDATLVNLDVGFSLRVKGASNFKHGYFGDTELSDIAWFKKDIEKEPILLKPEELDQLITDFDKLEIFSNQMNDALDAGSESFEYGEAEILLENSDRLKAALDHLKLIFSGKGLDQSRKIESKVIDISTNDEFCEFGTIHVPQDINECFYKDPLDFSCYKRQPYPHQLEGIKWVLGLSKESIDAPLELQDRLGALLADDMGLGKTYMSLISISEYYRLLKEKDELLRPVLVVAPLSLLENWKQEVFETFEDSPFNDIIILQSSADLKKYKLQGLSVETRQEVQKDTPCDNSIRYSLKIGPEHGTERLDLPKRLVLTTYQTLRDYQFSLCRIDWSFVIFDEAQNIKNPNTLQTRTAKGLKASFKLVVTGTPVENHLGDFWCLFDTARPGVLGAYQNYLKTFVLPILKSPPEKADSVRLEIGQSLRQNVGGFMLRRSKEDNLSGLPKKRIFVGAKIHENRREIFDSNLICTMEGIQLAKYNEVVHDTVANMDISISGNILRGLHLLRDLSLHPDLAEGGNLPIPENEIDALKIMKKSAKLQKVVELLSQVQERDEKAIIFILNKRLQTFMAVAINRIFGINVEIINGDTKAVAKRASVKTRVKIIELFQKQDGFGVLIMSPVAAGVGLTVTGANNVIHLERHWNPAKEDQATDRVYRIGQTRDVNVYIPIVHHPEARSFEVNLNTLLMQKNDLKDAIVTQEEVTGIDIIKSMQDQ